MSIQVEGRLASVIHYTSPVLSGDVYKISVTWTSYNPTSEQSVITLQDKLTNEHYDIPLHFISANTTQGLSSLVVYIYTLYYSLF